MTDAEYYVDKAKRAKILAETYTRQPPKRCQLCDSWHPKDPHIQFGYCELDFNRREQDGVCDAWRDPSIS